MHKVVPLQHFFCLKKINEPILVLWFVVRHEKEMLEGVIQEIDHSHTHTHTQTHFFLKGVRMLLLFS